MSLEWLLSDWQSAWLVLLSVALIYLAMLGLVRLVGLRSFSKMSATDFVLTIALGSVLATTVVSKSPSVVLGLCAVASLLFVKWSMALLRSQFPAMRKLADNTPLYLMRDGRFVEEQLRRSKVSKTEVHAKLREANVWNYEQVICVVLETTGDVAVLHRSKPDLAISPAIFADVAE